MAAMGAVAVGGTAGMRAVPNGPLNPGLLGARGTLGSCGAVTCVISSSGSTGKGSAFSSSSALGGVGVLYAPRGRELGRLAGALGIAGFVLFAIQVFRASGQNIEGLDTRIEIGAWLALAGSVIVLVAGFLSTPEPVVYET